MSSSFESMESCWGGSDARGDLVEERAEVGAQEGHRDDDDDGDEGDHEAVLHGGRALLRAEVLDLDECLGHDGSAFRVCWSVHVEQAQHCQPQHAGAMGRWGGGAPPNGPSTSTVRPIAMGAATALARAMLRPCEHSDREGEY